MERSIMTLLIVTTTGLCNLKCSYCGGSFPPHLVPPKEQYELKDLIALVKSLDADVAFYGGEPLINPKLIENVMDALGPRRRFIIQTNGTLFDNLQEDYWLRFDAILLSIDGRREVNDHYRGKGNYDTVLKTAKRLRELGYGGDLIARMTVWDRSDIFEEVTHLLKLGLFDHVHWQLNVIWTEPWDFRKWADNSYLPGIRRLVSLWVERMRQGEVTGIVPFLGIAKVALFGEWRSPPCGAGSETFTLLPDGRIVACPIAVDSEWAVVGDVRSGILRKVIIGEPCTSCSYFKYCGGRCLYTYMERHWGEKGFRDVCSVTKATIDEVLSRVGEIRSLIEEGVVKREEIYYPPYDNTTEIIP